MTEKMRRSLDLLRRARADDPTTDDGLIAGCATFYDSEIAVAYVNHQTAEALARAGYVTFGKWYGPEEGQALVLSAAVVKPEESK